MPSLAELNKDAREQAVWIIFKLSQLNFEASYASYEEGPILRTFYFKPGLESLFGRISSKGDEIAAALSVDSVRLFRKKDLLGVEVPRLDRQLVRFDSLVHTMLSSSETRDMTLPLLLGVSPKGEYLYADLATQPHLLTAGSTGSGKSVFVSMVVSSLALFRVPSDLHFILVDTKNLDLVLFRGLEHVKEIVTDVTVLRKTLEGLLGEVRMRTAAMSGVARNMREYNQLAMQGMQYPYKILIIDELADVLATDAALRSGMTSEERADSPSIASLIQRLTQISRAAGIHVIMATQRPSTKMVTGDTRVGFGDIKANFPARICFKLPTMADSRVVLDENGAESLLGKGDFLYKIAGSDEVKRAHSAYVSMQNIALILEQHNQIRSMYSQLDARAEISTVPQPVPQPVDSKGNKPLDNGGTPPVN